MGTTFPRVTPRNNPWAKHMCAKKFMRSKLPISKNKENISEQTSRTYALIYTLIN